MKVYLVGGAVRDGLLGRPINERDWVVVGSTPEELLSKGYQPVGKDFPVFIHPETGEEYALARTERKVGKGYHGFECFFSNDVTLEEDLSRRDLTINAMAQAEDGTIIDPFQGQKDLKNKLLRHVSQAFREDPLRLLRVARFSSRFYELGFRIAESTQLLLLEMVRQGELKDLTPGRVWQELNRSLSENTPDIFFKVLRKCGALNVLFPEVDALFGVPNPVQWHPEIDTGIHTLMALRQVTRLSKENSVRFSVLCHDLGKAKTPEQYWPSHPNHNQNSVEIIKIFCQKYPVPKAYSELAMVVARTHGAIHRVEQLSASKRLKILEDIDVYRRPERLEQVTMACIADYCGRKGNEKADYPQKAVWKACYEATLQVKIQDLLSEGLQGVALGERLREERLKKLQSIE